MAKGEWDRRKQLLKWQALRLKPKEVEAGSASVIRARIGEGAVRSAGRAIYREFEGFGEVRAQSLLDRQHRVIDSREHFLGHADLVYFEPPERVPAPREPSVVDERYEREKAYYEALVPLFKWVPDLDPTVDPWPDGLC